MSFETRETFIHLQNTNSDIFDAFWELSDPSIDSKDPYTIKTQKRSEEIGKIVHVLQSYENTFCVPRKQK